jgi:alkylhydroperoxidase/carboxymuconolactone decarboxylase family protein YurZ
MILTEKMALEDRIQTFEDLEKGLVPREEAIEIAMKRVEEQRVLNLEQATELVELKQKIEEDDAKVKKERAELVREKKKFEKDKEDLNIIAETNASRSEEFKQLGDILTRRERVLSKKEQEVIAKEKQHGDIDDIIVATKKEAKRAEEVERLNKQISTELTNYVLKLDEVVERERQLDSQVKALNAQVIDLVSENSKLTKK